MTERLTDMLRRFPGPYYKLRRGWDLVRDKEAFDRIVPDAMERIKKRLVDGEGTRDREG